MNELLNLLRRLIGTVKRIIGFGFLLIGAPFTIMAIVDLVGLGDKTTGTGIAAALTVFFGGLSYAGIRLIRSGRVHDPDDDSPQAREVAALRIARALGGTMGPAELAAQTGTTFGEAKATLDRLLHQGACQVVVSQTGAEFYRFPDLALAPGQAARVKDVLSE